MLKTRRTVLAVAFVAAAAAPLRGANVDTKVVSQLSCPLTVTKLVAVYGSEGARYKPSFYADVNPDKTPKLWVYGVFTNAGNDTITGFTCDVLVWDAAGKEIFKTTDVFDLPVEDKPAAKEWSWAFDGAAAAAVAVFIPRVIKYPAGRTWETDERFIEAKLKDLAAPDK